MDRKLDGTNFMVSDTNDILEELLSKDISDAYSWNDYYFFMLTNDNITVYVVNKDTKKVEWTVFTVFLNILENTNPISPEELKAELSK